MNIFCWFSFRTFIVSGLVFKGLVYRYYFTQYEIEIQFNSSAYVYIVSYHNTSFCRLSFLCTFLTTSLKIECKHEDLFLDNLLSFIDLCLLLYYFSDVYTTNYDFVVYLELRLCDALYLKIVSAGTKNLAQQLKNFPAKCELVSLIPDTEKKIDCFC